MDSKDHSETDTKLSAQNAQFGGSENLYCS